MPGTSLIALQLLAFVNSSVQVMGIFIVSLHDQSQFSLLTRWRNELPFSVHRLTCDCSL